MTGKRLVFCVVAVAVLTGTQPSPALNSLDISGLIGFTVVAGSQLSKGHFGATRDEIIELKNGWVFKITTVGVATWLVLEDVAVLAEHYTAAEIRAAGVKGQIPPDGLTVYKLLIDDEVYDAIRIR